MPLTIDQKQKFAQDLMTYANSFLSAWDSMENLLTRYNDLGLSGQYQAEDFTGSLSYLDTTNFPNAVSIISAIKTLMDAGHRGNLNRILR